MGMCATFSEYISKFVHRLLLSIFVVRKNKRVYYRVLIQYFLRLVSGVP